MVAAMRSLENALNMHLGERGVQNLSTFRDGGLSKCLISVVCKSGGEGGIRTPDTAFDRITV